MTTVFGDFMSSLRDFHMRMPSGPWAVAQWLYHYVLSGLRRAASFGKTKLNAQQLLAFRLHFRNSKPI